MEQHSFHTLSLHPGELAPGGKIIAVGKDKCRGKARSRREADSEPEK